MSFIASGSRSSENITFCGSTFMPSLAARVQQRTPVSPSTCTRQFGQSPLMHRNPRRRWYLKERETVSTPAR